MHCGFLAKQICEGAGMRQFESLFVRGLLHDIGHLVLCSKFPEACRHALSKSDLGLEARLAAEQQAIGINALQLATELARIWQLPQTFVDTFSQLMQPEQLSGPLAREVAVLHIAAQFSSGIDSGLLTEDILQQIRPAIWETAELPPDVGAAALDACNLEMMEAMYRVLTQQD